MSQADGIKILATIAALKLLVGKLYVDQLTQSGKTLEEIRIQHDNMVSSFSTGTLTVANDSLASDRLSQLVATEIRELLRQVERALEALQNVPSSS